ncbi:hypothetical protein RRG08_064570 [Elysia crispata]|uniref:Mitochondrial ribosomal protein L1 n=1 Tax=Elysia crispata TaxID=231223 RepID=A0AAE1EC15_9GAST|nr:hypothetical protein RRG08_064570 [Elysia crispata]
MAASIAKSTLVLKLNLHQVFQTRALHCLTSWFPQTSATTNYIQIRHRNSKQRVKDATVQATKERKFVSKKSKKKALTTMTAVEKSTILADKPVDDVWIRKFYPPPRFSIEEALQRHQAFAQPAMLNNLKGLIYLDMRLDFTTKKKTKFLGNIRASVRLPNEFPYGSPPNILVFCKSEENLNLATSLGAKHVGTPQDIIKQINEGVLNPKDFEHVLSTSECANEILPARSHFRDRFPQRAKGSLGPDLKEIWDAFYYGYCYESTKLADAIGRLQVPLGLLEQPVEDLVENFQTYITHICQHRPVALGPFIQSISVLAPPSPEEFIVRVEDYVPGYKSEDVDSDAEDEAEAMEQ